MRKFGTKYGLQDAKSTILCFKKIRFSRHIAQDHEVRVKKHLKNQGTFLKMQKKNTKGTSLKI